MSTKKRITYIGNSPHDILHTINVGHRKNVQQRRIATRWGFVLDMLEMLDRDPHLWPPMYIIGRVVQHLQHIQRSLLIAISFYKVRYVGHTESNFSNQKITKRSPTSPTLPSYWRKKKMKFQIKRGSFPADKSDIDSENIFQTDSISHLSSDRRTPGWMLFLNFQCCIPFPSVPRVCYFYVNDTRNSL